MEYFIIERPTLCLRAHLLHNAGTCGVNLLRKPLLHYTGNFWTTSCQYVKDVLQPTTFVWPENETLFNYISAETWIGNYMEFTPYFGRYKNHKYVNLFSLPFQLYFKKAALKKYEWIITRKTFLQLNHTYSKGHYLSQYPPGNQTDLWNDYFNGIQNLTIH